jgi:hypothetical protein
VSLLLLLSNPLYAKEPKPEFVIGQTDGQARMFLQASSTASKTEADPITITSSVPIPNLAAAASDWEDATTTESNIVTSTLVKNMDNPSKFLTRINSKEDITYSSYQLVSINTSNAGTTESQVPKDVRFLKWTDPNEKAATAFIPEGWNADLQIIRPYNSMTGFVFFARGDENTLVYVFQPFMPLYILPSTSLCETDSICFSSIISAEKVREMSLGNAPISVSNFKTPEQYFTSEVLPMLTRNLNGYTVDSAEPVYASVYGGDNSTDLAPTYNVDYNFKVENKKISGMEMIFTRNYTSPASDTGIWNGFIVGIESSENNFDRAFQQAAVTLLNLQFEEQWLNSERNVLLENANTSQALGAVPELMANSTLDDFYIIVPTAAHQMVRSYNNSMVADYLDKDSAKELHLPLFPELQHWYLNGSKLAGGDLRRNLMNASSLEPLF